MRKVLGATLAVALLLVSPAVANAAPAAGSFVVSDVTVTAVRPAADATCLISLTATFTFTGTLQGSFTAPFEIVHHGACEPLAPAAETFVARGTFTGDVVLGDVTLDEGTFDFVFVGSIDASMNARGTLHVLGGTGELKELGGALELTGKSGVGGTYSGTLST